jgi:ABC-type multidrug transport system fused ATPase/permease subunit
VGIVGSSGSGKTTLVNLLARFYDVSDGAILLDGRDLREYGLAALRQQIAILPQEPMLFSGSVAQNIAYARPDASRAEITAAAEAANAHEFISALPQSYDTKIGEGEWRLSVGQGQRIAIARAFLKRAPIIILDEPTSALDIHTEREIMAATSTLLHGRTAFIIAHRLNTVRDCDLLLVMQEGRLVTVSSDVQSVLDSLLASGETDRVLVP